LPTLCVLKQGIEERSGHHLFAANPTVVQEFHSSVDYHRLCMTREFYSGEAPDSATKRGTSKNETCNNVIIKRMPHGQMKPQTATS
jgi:hypothetical protein